MLNIPLQYCAVIQCSPSTNQPNNSRTQFCFSIRHSNPRLHRIPTTMPLYIPLFKLCTTATLLPQLHATLIVSGLHHSPLVATKLIQSYAQTNHLPTSTLIFTHFPSPDSFMYTAIIKAYTTNHQFKHSITLYQTMRHHNLHLSHYVFPPVLRACATLHDLTTGRKLHSIIIKGPFTDNGAVQTSLLQMYSGVGCLQDAFRIFDDMPTRDLISWSAMVSGCLQCGEAKVGLDMVSRMSYEGVELDSVAMMHAAQACGDLRLWKQARAVHGCMMRRLNGMDESVESSLVTIYGECRDLDSAEKVFMSACCRSVVLWTAIISCYNRSSCYREALGVFVRMQKTDVNPNPNAVTLMEVLNSCRELGCIREGKSVHGLLVRRYATATESEQSTVDAALMKFYASFSNIATCLRVFETARSKTLVMWNTLATVYAHNGASDDILMVFVRMRGEGMDPDSFTLASVLPACGHIGDFCLGAQIHSLVTKSGYLLNVFVQNSLIDMYCKCGSVETAYIIFSELEGKDIVTWNTMISGFSQNGNSEEAIKLFERMHLEGMEMDGVTFLSAIQACANLGSFGKGRWIHQNFIASGVKKDARIDTTLTVMYAKCGDIGTARRIFDSISEKNVVSWSSMISAYRSHGLADQTITLFSEMVASGIRPNEATFLSVLSACSHAGLVKEGILYFNMMRQDFGIEPQIDHCACMVDLLSRADRPNLAFDLIKTMPQEPNASIWRAVLSGYNIRDHRKR